MCYYFDRKLLQGVQMKLFKLSLAAAMAAGALATSANAVALEEAIKDVDVSGFAWMRVDWYDDNYAAAGAGHNKKDHAWKFKSVVNTKVAVDDNFFFVAGVRYAVDEDPATGRETDASTTGFDLYQGYLGYTVGGTTFQLGRQKIGAFFTDDMYGDGIKVVNADIEGLVLAALWMDALEADGDIDLLKDDLSALGITQNAKGHNMLVDGKSLIQNDLWGVAAIGSYDPVSFQIWYAYLQDVVGLFAVEGAVSFDVAEDVNLGLKLQYAFSDFDADYKALGVDDADFFGLEASTAFFGVDFSAGYLQYETDSTVHSRVSFEDQGSFISPGEELLDYGNFVGDNKAWFITAGYSIPDTGLRIGLDWVQGKFGDTGANDGVKAWETVARVDYKYNKKLSFTTWWSHVDSEDGDQDDHVRFQAKYAF